MDHQYCVEHSECLCAAGSMKIMPCVIKFISGGGQNSIQSHLGTRDHYGRTMEEDGDVRIERKEEIG